MQVLNKIQSLYSKTMRTMLDNENISHEEFFKAVKEIDRLKSVTHKKLSEAESAEDINKAYQYFECKINLQKVIAVGNTKKSTGELTEE